MPACRPSTENVPGSTSRSMRSRAVSLSAACCLAMRSSPPPRRAGARRSARAAPRGGSSEVGALVSVMRSRKSYFSLRDPSSAGAPTPAPGSVAVVAAGPALLDLLARRVEHVPLGAEGVDALALGAAGLVLVEHERVQR